MKTDIVSRISALSGIKAFKGDDESLRVVTIPFGIPNLDRAIGGGVPRGRVIHIAGDFGTGKTLLCQLLCKSVQIDDGTIAYFNAENKYDPQWFSRTGVDTSKITVIQGNIAESIIDAVVLCVKENVDLIIVDSAAALLPVSVDENDMTQQTIGLQPRVIAKGLMKIVEPLSLSRSSIIITNQLRSNIGGYGGDVSPGGKALKFYSSMCLDVRRGEWLKEKESRIGFEIKIRSSKNQIATPWKEVTIPFYYDGHVDILSCLCTMALDNGIISKSGAWYSFGETRAQGWDGLLAKLRADKDLVIQLSSAVFGTGDSANDNIIKEESAGDREE
jgi:recombination protein RecA